jgi:tetratricopeptide (TPR) repeat protein
MIKASHLVVAAALSLALAAATAGPSLAMGSSSPPAGDAAMPKANPDFAAAKAAIEKQDWKSAIALLTKVTQAEPKNPEAYNLLGYSVRKSGDPKASLQYYQTALELDPKHLGANEYIGEAYLQLGDVAKAEEHLQRLDELCTFGCTEYDTLKKAIAAYKAGKKSS